MSLFLLLRFGLLTLAWDANSEPDVVSYRVSVVGDVIENYTTTGTQVAIPVWHKAQVSFTVTAINDAGLESVPSTPIAGMVVVLDLERSTDLTTWQLVKRATILTNAEKEFYRINHETN